MTVSEIAYEFEWRRPQQKSDYAGGMTEGEIESIREESAKLRAWKKAQMNGAAPS